MATALLSVSLIAALSITLSSVVSITIVLPTELPHVSAEVLPLTGISLVLTVLQILLAKLVAVLFLLVRLLLEQEALIAEELNLSFNS